MGVKSTVIATHEWTGLTGVQFQVALVQTNTWPSLSKMVDRWHRVMFDPDRSYVEDVPTGKLTTLVRKRGLVVLQARAKPRMQKPNVGKPTRTRARRMTHPKIVSFSKAGPIETSSKHVRPNHIDSAPIGSSGKVLAVDGDSDDADNEDGIFEQNYDPPPVPEEVRLRRALRRPNETSKRDREEHQVRHLLYRSWCKECHYGKGNHDQHRTGQEDDKLDKDIQTVSMDPAFKGDEKVPADDNPIVVSYDNATHAIHSFATKKKGVTMWIAKAVGMDLESQGHGGSRICLK